MAKSKVGQGINALLSSIDSELQENPEAVVATLSSSVAEIPVNEIEVNPFQPRQEFDQDALNELSESIRVHGLIQPLTVRRLENNKYQLISGERRLRASILAKLERVPAYIRVANDQEMMEMALIENIQRQDLNAYEVAATYQRLIDEFELTHEKLSERVGKKRESITNYLRLLKLPPAILRGLKESKITFGHARALAGIQDIALQLSIFNQTVEQNLSVRDIEALVAKHQQPKSKTPAAQKLSDDYKRVQDHLTSWLGAKVSIKKSKDGKGMINIPFANDADLNRLLETFEKA